MIQVIISILYRLYITLVLTLMGRTQEGDRLMNCRFLEIPSSTFGGWIHFLWAVVLAALLFPPYLLLIFVVLYCATRRYEKPKTS